jgi:alkylation response protein AidB-like acyl-CoA dehydrogenase
MRHTTTEDRAQIRDLARSVAADRIAPHSAEVDESARFPVEGYRALVAAQLHAVVIPEAYGGVGADALTGVLVAEEIARVCATTQQVSGANELFSWPLLLAGTQEQRERWLVPIAAGEALGAFALSEPEAGSDVAALTMRAVETTAGWRLRGVKRWITNGGVADSYLLFAATEPAAGARGISAFVLHKSDAGLSFGAPERKMGLRGSPTTELLLDDVLLAADRLVGSPGDGLKIALATLDRTRTVVAAQAVGIAQGALDAAVEYAVGRRQFGKALTEFQAVAVRAARLLTQAAAAEIDAGAPTMGVAGAAAKLFASDTAMKVTTDAVQILGGAGYVRDFPVERMMRDAKVTQIYEGTNQIQRIVIARDLVSRRP